MAGYCAVIHALQLKGYAVDHTPSYLWESASRSISAALVVHLPTIAGGPDSWQKNETMRRAINIENGVIQKPDILAFQNCHSEYPHATAEIFT